MTAVNESISQLFTHYFGQMGMPPPAPPPHVPPSCPPQVINTSDNKNILITCVKYFIYMHVGSFFTWS